MTTMTIPPSIVGMWHVIFTAHTVNGNPIPSNAYPMIDNALVVWHSDKTEIMNSARPPQDGNFCLGVWEKTGARSYYLNHIPWLGNDTTNAPSGIGNPAGPTQITERVTLSEDGNKYAGTFTLVAYNLDENKAVTFTGVLAGTRITTSTSAHQLVLIRAHQRPEPRPDAQRTGIRFGDDLEVRGPASTPHRM